MDYIEIKGYKSIKEQKVDFRNINILIGSNGSGKSNFISFFEFLNQLYNRNLQEYISLRGGEDKILFEGKDVTDQIYFKVEFNGGVNGYSATLKVGEESLIFTDEKLIYNKDGGRSINGYSPEARIKTTDNYRAKYVIKYLEGFRKYHFHDTGTKSPFTQMSHIENDIYYLYEKGENLAAFLYNIQMVNPKVYQRIVSTIQSVAPYFSDFFFQPNKENYIRLQWKDKFSNVVYGVNDLSDGTIRFIALATLFMQPELPQTIIIDEPELGLHPAAISKLAGLIKSVASKQCQVILATQSTDLISHFEPEDIITVDRISGESVFRRLDSESLSVWLDEYTVDDLWKRNIITSGQPNY
ncbi:AAA family ATPase [Parabacteroides sp.]|uniref:AAA family ATPase n=1 Tax=Parabacteroides sp. TaxID=1869337 RepID=UPI0030800C11